MTRHFNPKKYSSTKSLASAISNFVEDKMEVILREIVEKYLVPRVRKFINTNWYQKSKGSIFYSSQGQMASIYGVKKDKMGSPYMTIGYDTSKISPTIPSNTTLFKDGGVGSFLRVRNTWPSYASMSTGEDFTQYMPYIIENGWSTVNLLKSINAPFSFYAMRTSRPGIEMKENLYDDLFRHFNSLLQDRMTQQGFKVR